MRIDPEEFDNQLAYVKKLADSVLNTLDTYRKELINYKWENYASANRSKYQRLRKELAQEMIAMERIIYKGHKDE